jgi:putative transposase
MSAPSEHVADCPIFEKTLLSFDVLYNTSPSMKLKSGEIYHVYSRGNNRQRVFYDRENYFYFISKMKQYLVPNCDLLAYSLMPNHFHFLIHANRKSTFRIGETENLETTQVASGFKMTRFSKGIQLLLSSYAKGINKRYGRSGSLFRQNTKSKRTSSEYFLQDYSLQCFMYIHNNPVTAGLVHYPEEWEFSSVREYMGFKNIDSLCNVALAKELLRLDINEIQYLNTKEVPTEIIRKIFR